VKAENELFNRLISKVEKAIKEYEADKNDTTGLVAANAYEDALSMFCESGKPRRWEGTIERLYNSFFIRNGLKRVQRLTA
jgi:hypothetical protein